MKLSKNFLAVLSLAMIFYSCSENESPLNSDDQLAVETESTIEFAFEDADDMMNSGLAVSDADAGNRTGSDEEGENDDRWRCASFSHEKTGDKSGTIRIDFGEGCTDPRGRTRKGAIVITYQGRRWVPGSVVETTFEDYSIKPSEDSDLELALEGVRRVENISESLLSAPTFHVTLTNGLATFSDGTTHERNVDRIKRWIRGASPMADTWEVTGTAEGINRIDVAYTVTIQEPLIFSRACFRAKVFAPVSGIKVITTDTKTITIDYGDGSCDNTVAITVNGGETSQVDLRRR